MVVVVVVRLKRTNYLRISRRIDRPASTSTSGQGRRAGGRTRRRGREGEYGEGGDGAFWAAEADGDGGRGGGGSQVGGSWGQQPFSSSRKSRMGEEGREGGRPSAWSRVWAQVCWPLKKTQAEWMDGVRAMVRVSGCDDATASVPSPQPARRER